MFWGAVFKKTSALDKLWELCNGKTVTGKRAVETLEISNILQCSIWFSKCLAGPNIKK